MHKFDEMTEPELKAFFEKIAQVIDAMLPPDTAFILLAAEFRANNPAQYVAKGDRGDCIKWMLETADRFLAGDDVPR